MVALEEQLLLRVVEPRQVGAKASGAEPVDDRLRGGHLLEIDRAPNVHVHGLKTAH